MARYKARALTVTAYKGVSGRQTGTPLAVYGERRYQGMMSGLVLILLSSYLVLDRVSVRAVGVGLAAAAAGSEPAVDDEEPTDDEPTRRPYLPSDINGR